MQKRCNTLYGISKVENAAKRAVVGFLYSHNCNDNNRLFLYNGIHDMHTTLFNIITTRLRSFLDHIKCVPLQKVFIVYPYLTFSQVPLHLHIRTLTYVTLVSACKNWNFKMQNNPRDRVSVAMSISHVINFSSPLTGMTQCSAPQFPFTLVS